MVFRPLLVEREWAGQLMRKYLGGGYGELQQDPGEAWLLFDDGKHSSTLANGPLADTHLGDIARTRPEELVGSEHTPGKPFPLAVRLLDTAFNQPLQVHPDEGVIAGASSANAKFWHSLDSDSGARIIVGISRRVTSQQILLNLDKPGFERLLQRYPGRPGDSFLVPPGFVHSIGANNLVFELQQRHIEPLVLRTGDAPDAPQRLDKQAALSAIKRETRTNLRIPSEAGSTTHTRRIKLIPNCPYFQVEEIRLHDHIFLRTRAESFNLVAVTKGRAIVRWQNHALKLAQGMLCCIPACCGDYKVEAVDGYPTLLRISL
jgi:mannose-6-phosphate isomerase